MCVASGRSTTSTGSSHRWPDAHVLEHACPTAEQHRHDVHLDLVHQPGGDVLPPHDGAAHDHDVLLAGGVLRLTQGGLDAVGHEVIHAVRRGLGGHVMRDDEHRDACGAARPVGAPPRQGVVVGDAAHDHRSTVAHHALGVFAVLRIGAEPPLVQPLTVLAERFLRRLFGCGHESVERHAGLEDHASHRFLPFSRRSRPGTLAQRR